jgi:hypothetical protein
VPAVKVNREQWLHRATRIISSRFAKLGYPLPSTMHLSIGFPSRSALAKKNRRIGECWGCELSKDGAAHIFISPLLGDALDVLATLVHEHVHVVAGSKAKHGPRFRKIALAVGLTGKMTSTKPGEELTDYLQSKVLAKLPTFPHAELTATERHKKQSTRLLKVCCAECGYTARVTRKWVVEVGTPLCPCNEEPMDVDLGQADDELALAV